MGLDISVYKVLPVEKKNAQSVEDYYVLKELPNLAPLFRKLAFSRLNVYHDVPRAIRESEFTNKQLRCVGISYGKDSVWSFINNAHPLHKAYKWLEDNYRSIRFGTLAELENSELYKEFEKKFKTILLKNGWKESYRSRRYDCNLDIKYSTYDLGNANEFCRKAVHVEIKNPPLTYKKELCIAIKEVGYQRKGANKQFYEDGMWDSTPITDLKTLTEHWEKYFSKQTPESQGGFGSGVERDLTDREMKKEFKENIIDKFVEGETFVIYH